MNSSGAGAQSGIFIGSGGGYRIVNNKINFGGTNSTGISVNPNLGVTQNIEPLIIANNSLEGMTVGIGFNNSNVANANINLVNIVGNEIWAGTAAIFVSTQSTTNWISGISIVGNTLQVNGGGAGKVVMTLDNISIGIDSVEPGERSKPRSPSGMALIDKFVLPLFAGDEIPPRTGERSHGHFPIGVLERTLRESRPGGP